MTKIISYKCLANVLNKTKGNYLSSKEYATLNPELKKWVLVEIQDIEDNLAKELLALYTYYELVKVEKVKPKNN